MNTPNIAKQGRAITWLLGLVAPIFFNAGILVADYFEGPKTAYVGVIACIPLLAAIFGNPLVTVIVSVLACTSAYLFGLFASDGNVQAQTTRLIIIAVVCVIALLANLIRVRREKQAQELLAAYTEAQASARLALVDVMTGLPNRRGIIHQINGIKEEQLTMVILDCDKLKRINDELGHLAGDAYITHIAHTLRARLTDAVVFGRWGGDEFLALFPGNENEVTRSVSIAIDSLIANGLELDGVRVAPEVSAGISVWNRQNTIDSALHQADTALYSAKHADKSRVCVYSHDERELID